MELLNKLVYLALIASLAPLAYSANASADDQNGSAEKVPAYLFWQIGCPHCEELKPFMSSLEEKYSRLDLKRFEVSKSQEGSDLFDESAKAYGKKAKITPTVFIGDYMIEGYNGWITEERIEGALINCTEKKCPTPEEKIAEYRNKQATTSTCSTTTSTTTSTTSTTSTTTTTPPTTTSSSTTTTTVTSTTTTTTLPPAEKNEDTPMVPGALLAILLILILFALMRRKKNGADRNITG
ncbi:MAG: hypothetical protein WAX07_00125 [Candidatus Altiarchaeia archaeon]